MVNGGNPEVPVKGALVHHDNRHFFGKMAANGEIVYVDWKFNAVGVRYGDGDVEEYGIDRLTWTETAGGGYWDVEVYD